MSVGEIAFIAGFMFGTAFGFLLGAVLVPDSLPMPCDGGGRHGTEEGK